MPYALPNVLKCCSVGSADLLLLSLLTPTAIFALSAIPTVLGSCSPFYTMTFVMYPGIACLDFACWDSLSGFAL